METQFGIRKLLKHHPIIPVVNITDVAEVENIIDALQKQSIQCIEITLRSPLALEAIEKAIAIKPAHFHVGVGTIVKKEQVANCVHLGVDFMVSPGVSDEVAAALVQAEIPFLPGVMTPSEIISALNRGWDTFKLFPFNVAGGTTALKAYASVFPSVKFCPTGGLNAKNYEEVSALKNVIAVGGSWVLK